MTQADTGFEISSLGEGELDALFEADGVSFGMRTSGPLRDLIEGHLRPERVLVSRDGAEIVGTAVSEPSVETLPGLSRLPVGIVLAVSVVPSHRRQGRLRALMRRQLDELREQGAALAMLYATEGGIYGRFGYGMATFGSDYQLDKRVARLADSALDLVPGRVRLIDRRQATDSFAAVYSEYALTRAGEVDRNELDFLHAVGEPGGEDLSRRFYAVYEEGGRIDGYVGYEVAPMQPLLESRPRRVICHELCHLTSAAYVALWHFLLSIDLTDELRARGRPVDEPIGWLLTDYRHLRTVSSDDRSWLRLIDVPTALAGRLYPQPGTLVLEVEDEFCSWNAGRYRLHVPEEWAPAEIERTDAPADISLDVSLLASVYLGGVRPSELRISQRVRQKSDGALDRADRMFANDRPPYCLTTF